MTRLNSQNSLWTSRPEKFTIGKNFDKGQMSALGRAGRLTRRSRSFSSSHVGSQLIGLMIYNTVEYVGIPLDIIIRKYRNECVIESDFIKSAADGFLECLSGFTHSIDDEKSYLHSVLTYKYSNIQAALFKNFRQATSKRGPYRKSVV